VNRKKWEEPPPRENEKIEDGRLRSLTFENIGTQGSAQKRKPNSNQLRVPAWWREKKGERAEARVGDGGGMENMIILRPKGQYILRVV